MSESIASMQLGGILTYLAVIFAVCGAFLLFKGRGFKGARKPKAEPKQESVSAPVSAPISSDVPSGRAEFSFELETKAQPAEISTEPVLQEAVPQLLAEKEEAPLLASEPPVAVSVEVQVPEIPAVLPAEPEATQASAPAFQVSEVTSIHVMIWTYDGILERLNPEHALEALNEFHSIGVSWAEKHQATYERSTGGSFLLHWTDQALAAQALRCALELRQEFMEWNELRKAQAYMPFTIVMGADRGLAMKGMIGPESHRVPSVVGKVTARSRALAQIALSLKSSLLASEELWSSVSKCYVGEKVASATLTAFDDLTSCYKVKGYIGEHGQEVWLKGSENELDPASCQVDAPRIEKSEQSALWRVNNGSQILGPMSAKEVAQALYTLELDFDCECWEEGRGDRVTIENSGMFGSEQEDGAFFWVYDSQTVHGPFTEEFLKTGMGRKTFPRDSYVCEKSTVNGWKPLMELRASIGTQVETSLPEVAAAPVFEAAPVLVAEPELAPAPEPELVAAPVAESVQVEPVSLEVAPIALEEAPAKDQLSAQAEPQPEHVTEASTEEVAFVMPVLEVAESSRKKVA